MRRAEERYRYPISHTTYDIHCIKPRYIVGLGFRGTLTIPSSPPLYLCSLTHTFPVGENNIIPNSPATHPSRLQQKPKNGGEKEKASRSRSTTTILVLQIILLLEEIPLYLAILEKLKVSIS